MRAACTHWVSSRCLQVAVHTCDEDERHILMECTQHRWHADFQMEVFLFRQTIPLPSVLAFRMLSF